MPCVGVVVGGDPQRRVTGAAWVMRVRGRLPAEVWDHQPRRLHTNPQMSGRAEHDTILLPSLLSPEHQILTGETCRSLGRMQTILRLTESLVVIPSSTPKTRSPAAEPGGAAEGRGVTEGTN